MNFAERNSTQRRKGAKKYNKNLSMKIGVDCSCLREEMTGVGTYLFYLLKELIVMRADDHFFLYVPRTNPNVEAFLNFSNVTVRKASFCSFSEALWSQTTLAKMAFDDRVDLFWGATQSLPFFKRKNQKQIMTVFDFAYKLYPESVSRVRGFYLRLCAPYFYRKADALISISRGTQQKLQRFSHVVIPPLKVEGPKIDPAVLKKYGVAHKGYLLMIATQEPRKNIEGAIEAYSTIKRDYPNEPLYPLLIAGGKGWRSKKLNHAIEKIGDAQVKFLGFVSECELHPLLSSARFLLTPSHYEGYGMMVAEARMCQTEVICSDVPELLEAAEGDAHLLNKKTFTEDLLKILRIGRLETKKQLQPKYSSNKELAYKLSIVINAICN